MPVVEAKGDNSIPEYEQLLKSQREKWNLAVGSPVTQNMGEKIMKRGDHVDEFKRDFIVFVVSSMLKQHQNRKANYKILFFLIDINKIKNLNQCHFTMKSLGQSIEEWKKK